MSLVTDFKNFPNQEDIKFIEVELERKRYIRFHI